jgi:hypothetical protein
VDTALRDAHARLAFRIDRALTPNPAFAIGD